MLVSPWSDKKFGLLKDTTNQPLRRPPIIENLPFLTTSSISDAVGTPCTTYSVLGDFKRLMIGMRTSLRIEVLKERYAEYFQYGFLVFLRADVQAEHDEAFCQITNIDAQS